MAIPDFVNVTTYNVAGTTPVSVGSPTSGSETYRGMVFIVSVRDTSGFFTVSSGTWNGSALTQATSSRIQTQDASTGQRVNTEIWYILDPIASTAGALVLSLSANATRVLVHAINITGPSGPLSFDVSGINEDDATGSTAVSVSITTTGTDRLIIAGCVKVDTTITTSWTELTSASDTAGTTLRMASAYGDQASAGAATYNATLSGTDEWNISAVAFYETPAAGGAFPHRVIGTRYHSLVGRVA